MRRLLAGLVVAGMVLLAGVLAQAQDYERIITRAYEDILGRQPDQEGMRHFRSRMIDDRWDEARVRAALRDSDEYRQRQAEVVVTRAYEDILGRQPDREGMRNFRSRMIDDRWDEARVRAALRDSDEYRQRQIDVVINRAYDDLLRRKPDRQGLENYRRKMLREGWDERRVRQDIMNSDEYRRGR